MYRTIIATLVALVLTTTSTHAGWLICWQGRALSKSHGRTEYCQQCFSKEVDWAVPTANNCKYFMMDEDAQLFWEQHCDCDKFLR